QHSQRGRIIVITGGATGIGLSIAHAFAGADALSVHLLGRTSSTLLSAKSGLDHQYTGCKVHIHVTDIADERRVNEAFESIKRSHAEEKYRSGYTLIHAAAFLPLPEDLGQTARLEWWQTFEINVNGTFLVFRAFSNLVQAQPPNRMERQDDMPHHPRTIADDEAVIVNLVSASGYAFTAPGISAYASSELAAIRIAESVACENMAKSNRARIVNLHLGAVMTEMWKKSGGESLPEEIDKQLCQRSGIYVVFPPFHPEEQTFANTSSASENLVPQFVLWLTTPAAHFLHGRTVEANWDIDELLAQEELIVTENLLTVVLRGYPFDSAEAWDAVLQDSLLKEAAMQAEN
ncbi:MAG: hypothetical protein Q9178_006881, partial [Gyalolechia marmorata]